MMNDKELLAALEQLKEQKRKFSQSFDMIIALKGLDLRKPDQQVEFFMQVHKTLGKKRKVCALVGPEMADEAKKVFDTTLTVAEFEQLDKKALKRIANEHDFFVGQANIMPKIAATWGRVLGPRSKMPNPKAGCVVPPKAPLQPVYDKLQKTLRISAKKSPNIQVLVGTEDMDLIDVVDNIKTVYDQVVHHLPQERNNIKHVFVKLTMSKPVKVM